MLFLLGRLRRVCAAFLDSKRAFHFLVVILFFVPHVFGSGGLQAPYFIGWPRISSGDEPHYLVFLHSLVDDGDLDLSNNYARVHQGFDDAGWNFRGYPLDHHSVWFRGDRRLQWYEVFQKDPPWPAGPDGHPVPRLLDPNMDPADLPTVELPWNSPGLPLVLSPFFILLKKIGLGQYMEPAVTILSGLMLVIATFFWRMIANTLTSDRRAINLSLAFAFLGTPALHYGRSFFSEPYLICIMTAAFAYALAKGRFAVSGFLIGFALIIKPLMLVLGLPLGVWLLVRRKPRDVIAFTLPVFFWISAQLVLQKIIYGGASHMSNEFTPGSIIPNGLEIFAHPTRGLLSTAPTLVIAMAGWPALTRRSPKLLALLFAFVINFIVAAHNHAWSGGHAFSIRFFIPMMPLFALGLIPLATSNLRSFVTFIGCLSIVINGTAAIQYWRAFNTHPFLYMIPESEHPG